MLLYSHVWELSNHVRPVLLFTFISQPPFLGRPFVLILNKIDPFFNHYFLTTVVLPRAEFDIDSGETVCEKVTDESTWTKIELESRPFAVSFGYFNGYELYFSSQPLPVLLTIGLSN